MQEQQGWRLQLHQSVPASACALLGLEDQLSSKSANTMLGQVIVVSDYDQFSSQAVFSALMPCIYLYFVYIFNGMVTSSMLLVTCRVCLLVLYQMRSYLLLIRYADTVREIVSRLGRLIQVLEH